MGQPLIFGRKADGTAVPVLVNDDGAIAITGSSGGSGGGDASAANQIAIRDRLPATLGAKAGAASLSAVRATGVVTAISGTVTTGGTAQVLAAANSLRGGITVQNTSAGDLRVNPWGTASSTAGFRVSVGQLLVLDAPHCGVGAISIWGATTGQTFVGGEAV